VKTKLTKKDKKILDIMGLLVYICWEKIRGIEVLPGFEAIFDREPHPIKQSIE
jgi:hypothetical protein